MKTRPIRDEDGIPLKVGDHITFSFGIPPTPVLAVIVVRGVGLWVESLWPEDVKPRYERLERLMKWYSVWKVPRNHVAAVKRGYRPPEVTE